MDDDIDLWYDFATYHQKVAHILFILDRNLYQIFACVNDIPSFVLPGGDPSCISLTPNPKYRGQTNITRSGRICQRWADQKPHSHDVTTAELLPDATLEEASNFCRTPSNSQNKEPWCFTIDPAVRWERCAFQTRICRTLFSFITTNCDTDGRIFSLLTWRAD